MGEERPDRSADPDSAEPSTSDPGDRVDDDPFEELPGAESGVEDPFAELDASTGGDADAGVPESSEAPPVADTSDAGDSEEDFFGDIEPADSDEDFFEEMETADLDEEAVWESVLAEPATESEPESEPEAGSGADAVVRAEQYCKKCEHFSEPADLACDNPGTEIVEVVGVGEFRVRDCPVVAARRRADAVFPDEG